MAGKVKGLALMGAIALSLTGARVEAADTPQDTPTPPATSPHSVIQLTEADFERLRELGITTTQAEVDLELDELQADEVYGPVDLTGLQRTVNADMQQTLGENYGTGDAAQRAYLAQLRERFEENPDRSNRVRLVLAESRENDATLRVKRIGLEYHQEF